MTANLNNLPKFTQIDSRVRIDEVASLGCRDEMDFRSYTMCEKSLESISKAYAKY